MTGFGKSLRMVLLPVFLAVVCSCGSCVSVVSEPFGELSSGVGTTLFTVRNPSGASMSLLDYGARIVSINMPDRSGGLGDVIVGYGDLADFENGDRFIGPVIGRYANRIDGASFTLDGEYYALAANEEYSGIPVQCHGGPEGFDRFVWDAEIVRDNGCAGVRFSRLSPDGEQGFPGNLRCSVTYWLTEDNTVRAEYAAVTDKPTIVNLSNHSYFNLKGNEGGYVMDHLLTVMADTCVQNNLRYCPDILLLVEDTPFDFSEAHRIDYRLDMPNRQLEIMRGMSVCWKVRDWDGTLRQAADLYDPVSGRGVETWTTEPALLVYTGRGLNGSYRGKYGPLTQFGGMLLETIHFADSPNQPRFPSTVLRPGETYRSATEWRFYSR